MTANMTDAERWSAVVSRERGAQFIYAVRTTNIYCRPSCPSRRPHPDNVLYFDAPEVAERAGFRPCRRCDPRRPEPRVGLLVDLCRYLEANSGRRVTLAELSEFAELSPFHLQRVFREEVGVSPREYHAALNNRYAEPGETVMFDIVDSPLGRMLIAESRRGLCAVSFGSDDQELSAWLKEQFPYAAVSRGELAASVRAVLQTFETGACDLPLDIRGTAFQQRVWNTLRSIPSGETRTYEELAAAIRQPRAVRAVANACGANRLAIVIPCHRIVRKDGTLSGYRWGTERKRAILDREHA